MDRSEKRELVGREIRARQIAEESERFSQSFSEFVRAAWREIEPETEFIEGWHIDAICEHLEAVTAGEIKRLQIWVPPQSMKSRLISILWPAWEWTHSPGTKYWTACYANDLSGHLAQVSLGLMLGEWYQARWPVQFERDAEKFFKNVRGGFRLSTSPESKGTGYHGNRILLDDVIKAQQVVSKAEIEDVNNWFDGTASTRGLPGHARILVMQRLHENDIAAHLIEIEDYVVLALPERYWDHPYAWRGRRRDVDSLGSRYGGGDPRKKEGEYLWTATRPPNESDAIAHGLRHQAGGQLQQWPTPREGNLLKRNWWRYYDPRMFDDKLPARDLEIWRKRRPKLTRIVQSVDTPLKDKESNDLVSIQAWGIKGADRFLIDIRTEHMNYSQAKRAIVEQARYVRKLYPRIAHTVLIENAGYGVELLVELKRELTGVTKISAGQDGDKIMRAEAASADLESGNCWLPGVGGGADETLGPARTVSAQIKAFIESCAIFPYGTHDDDVDAWSQCMNWQRSKIVAPGRTASPYGRRRRAPTRAAA